MKKPLPPIVATIVLAACNTSAQTPPVLDLQVYAGLMEFLTSSEGRVNRICFRPAGVLLPIISHPTHPQRAEPRPALVSQDDESDQRTTFN